MVSEISGQLIKKCIYFVTMYAEGLVDQPGPGPYLFLIYNSFLRLSNRYISGNVHKIRLFYFMRLSNRFIPGNDIKSDRFIFEAVKQIITWKCT